MQDFDLKQLRHFKAIYELNSISTAASHLGLTQSALTKSLKKLETRLGLDLFHRHTRELVATKAAQELYPNILSLLANSQDLNQRCQDVLQGSKGHVNMACGPLIEQILSPLLLPRLIAKQPDLKIKIGSGDFKTLSYGLINHEFDFLLYDKGNVQDLHEPERFHIRPLKSLPLYFVASPQHPVFSQNANPLDCQWALPSIPIRFKNTLPDALYGRFLNAGIPQYQLENMGLCLDLAKQAHVISVAPKSLIMQELKADTLKVLNLPIKVEANFALYRLRSRKLNTCAEHLIRHIKAIFSDLY